MQLNANRAERTLLRVLLVGLLAGAAVNFGLQLGSSSYFVDEVLSIEVSAHPLGSLMHAVAHVEITPPAYFVFQHEWMTRLGSQAEWVTRLPSVVFGVVLVAAVYWLARVAAGAQVVAIGSAALAALSPLLLHYSRLAQGYVLAALLVTVSVSAVLTAEGSGRHPRTFLWLGGLLAAIALCVNYTAGIPVAMLCVWLLVKGGLPRRWRGALVTLCVLVELGLLPLFIIQWRNSPARAGVGSAADVSWANLGNLIRLPFYGPTAPLEAVGIAVTVAAAAAVLVRHWRQMTPNLALVVAVAVGQPAILILLSAFGARVAVARYAVVAAPFLIVVVAAGLAAWPKFLARVGALAAVLVCAAGLAAAHRRSGFYPDARGVVDFIQSHRDLGDAVISPQPPDYAVPLAYYGALRLRPVLPYAFSGSAAASTLVHERRRLWVIAPVASNSVTAARVAGTQQQFASRLGYRVVRSKVLPSLQPLSVTLWSPTRPTR